MQDVLNQTQQILLAANIFNYNIQYNYNILYLYITIIYTIPIYNYNM